MASPYLGEIRIFSFELVPKGWALCNGQTLPINQYQALFSLLGTAYGGDGQTTFALPNLQGRAPIHVGAGYVMGQAAGEPAVTLSVTQIPAHTHSTAASSGAASMPSPSGNLWAALSSNAYAPAGNANVSLSPAGLAGTGGSQPHDNMAPFLTLSFCIALTGIFPSRS